MAVTEPRKAGFCFYVDWIEQLRDCPNRDFRAIVTAAAEYRCLDKELPPDTAFSNPVSRTAARSIFQICRISKTREINGRKGASKTRDRQSGNMAQTVDKGNGNPEQTARKPAANPGQTLRKLPINPGQTTDFAEKNTLQFPDTTRENGVFSPGYTESLNITEQNKTEPNTTTTVAFPGAGAFPEVVEVAAGERELSLETADTQARELITAYHTLCPSLPRVEPIGKGILSAARQALTRHTMDEWEQVFRRAQSSAFLCGGGKSAFKASLPWILDENHCAAIASGKYDRGNKGTQTETNHTQYDDGGFLNLLQLEDSHDR